MKKERENNKKRHQVGITKGHENLFEAPNSGKKGHQVGTPNSGKKGQVTIFIIIGVLIVLAALLIFFLVPSLNFIGFDAKNPQAEIQSCMENSLKENVQNVSVHGGSLKPELYYEYNGDKIQYLCYTEEYYKTCVVQKPLLKQSIEKEIKDNIRSQVNNCFNTLEENYEKRNYNIDLNKKDYSINLLPNRVKVDFDYELLLSKTNKESQKYDSMAVSIDNNIYELVSIASSILQWETKYGDSETTMYMTNYPDLKVEKKKQSEGTTIYIITNRKTENKFQFASRSLAWPPGYA